jgi:hypothetical protein
MTILRPDDITDYILLPLTTAGFGARWNQLNDSFYAKEHIQISWAVQEPTRLDSPGSGSAESTPPASTASSAATSSNDVTQEVTHLLNSLVPV